MWYGRITDIKHDEGKWYCPAKPEEGVIDIHEAPPKGCHKLFLQSIAVGRGNA
jgi:hypothetical protein